METFHSNSLQDTKRIAKQFANQLKVGDIVVLEGTLGAGKTEVVRAICEYLDVEEIVTSPTFTIINEYHTSDTNLTIFHIDLYRIKSVDELVGIGFFDIMEQPNAIYFFEWAENAFGLLPSKNYKITLTPHLTQENVRTITIEKEDFK